MIYTLGDRRPQFKGDYFVADNAAVMGSVVLENDVSVWFGCVLRGDCDDLIVGEGSNVQDGAVLHADIGVPLKIGRDCVVGHLAMLHGCTIGDNCLIGIQSTILNRAVIGNNCIVGANALITEGKTFPDGSLIVGSPAKVVRQLTPQEIQFIKLNAEHYVQNFKRFKKELRAMSA